MKKTITIIALAALFVSCAKEAEQTPAASGNVVTVAPTEFSATLETPESDTKTTLGGTNGKQVLWEEGDSISVWPGVLAQAKYTLSAGAGTNSATFTSDQTVTGDEIPVNVALYPYDENVTLDRKNGDFINVTFPEVQNYRENSWDKGAMLMAAMSDDHNFQFMNFAGVLRLTLTGTATIDSIRVSALDNDIISGTARVTIAYYPNEGDENTVLVAFDSESSSNTETLDCGESGVKLSKTEGTVFNIVIPPITGGFKVAIYDNAHGFMELKSNSRIKRNIILNMPPVDYAPNAIDLGLSVYWATCNVGADTPEDYGDYFAWGETEPKETYNWSNYEWCEGSETTITKYNTMSAYGTSVDNKTTLEPDDDAATVNCGADWRMPTWVEMSELIDTNYCVWTWTTKTNGVSGYNVVSKKNSASIFLPAAGYREGDFLCEVGSLGCYWSSSLAYTSTAISLYLGYFDGFNDVDRCHNSHYFGLPVRPVVSKGIIINNIYGVQ